MQCVAPIHIDTLGVRYGGWLASFAVIRVDTAPALTGHRAADALGGCNENRPTEYSN